MNKFSVVYANEVKKMFKGKSLFIIALVVVLLLALLTVSFELIIQNVGFVTDSSQPKITTPEQGLIVYQEMITQLEIAKESGNYTPKFNDNAIRVCRRYITYYTYLIDHNMAVGEAQPYMPVGSEISSLASGMGYVNTIMQVVLMLAIIAVVIYGSSNIIGELKSGALKMQLIRPISRSSMLSAKAAASMTGGLFIYGGATLVGIIYAMARFNKMMLPQVVFFNDTTATLIPAGGIFAITFLSGLLSLVFYCSLTYSLGFVSNNKNVALAVPIAIVVLGEIVSMALGYIYIGYIDPLYNLDFMNTMSISSGIYAGSNVLVSIGIVLLYIAAFITYNYITFKKRDLN